MSKHAYELELGSLYSLVVHNLWDITNQRPHKRSIEKKHPVSQKKTTKLPSAQLDKEAIIIIKTHSTKIGSNKAEKLDAETVSSQSHSNRVTLMHKTASILPLGKQ